MAKPLKVLWREGIFLAPQHFQAWDRHHEWQQWYLTRSTVPFNWGIVALDLDVAQLTNHVVSISRLEAVLRDGTVICAPEIDLAPASRSFERYLRPDIQKLNVYVAMRRELLSQPCLNRQKPESGSSTRYFTRVESVEDMTTGADSRDIEFAAKQLEIRFDFDSNDGMELLQIARVDVRGSGGSALASDYVPACLQVGAAAYWRKLSDELLRGVNSKMTELMNQLSGEAGLPLTPSLADLPQYSLAVQLSEFLPRLVHIVNHPGTHPFHLYQVLSELAARLAVLNKSLPENPAEMFSPYDHDGSYPGAEKLGTFVRSLFRTSRVVDTLIPLTAIAESPGTWRGDLSALKQVGNAEFYVWVGADLPEGELISSVIVDCRVGSVGTVEQLLMFGLPGIPLEAVHQQPHRLPNRPRGIYFRIKTTHEMWREVVESKQVQLSLPAAKFPSLKLELHHLVP